MAQEETAKTNGGPLKAFYKFFTSFKLATIVLILMTIVTLFGTLAQVE